MATWFERLFKRKVERYEIFGFLLMTFGALFSEYSFVYLSNISLTAVGVSSLILGTVSAFSPRDIISENMALSVLKESFSNIEELLKQFEAHGSGVYLPPSYGRFIAFASLDRKPDPDEISKVLSLSSQTLVKATKSGLFIYMPISSDILPAIGNKKKIERVLKKVLVDQMNILDSLNAREYEDKIVVRMIGSRIESQYPVTEKIFGSIPSNLIGCILSFYLNKPLIFISESKTQNVITARYEFSK